MSFTACLVIYCYGFLSSLPISFAPQAHKGLFNALAITGGPLVEPSSAENLKQGLPVAADVTEEV